ncbi:MAG TPA: efflux RND transporter periplasmic adaptor subunit [Planctomycetota bacterium]|nr:efflux RND transporter periplasmic adaptor subunit [Planctomycetota bacterium]
MRSTSYLPLLLWAAGAAGCGVKAESPPGASTGGSTTGKPAADSARVRVALVARGEIAAFLETTATVESEAMVDVYPKAAGVVRFLDAEEGTTVAAGAVLARIEDEDATLNERSARVAHEEAVHRETQAALALEEAGKRAEQARIAAEQSKRDWDRTRAMASPEDTGRPVVVAPKDVEAAKLAWEKAEGERALADFGVKKVGLDQSAAKVAVEKAQIAWDLAKRRLADTRIVAPFAGVVADRRVKVGETVSGATRAFCIVDAARLRVTLPRPQRELPLVREGLSLVAWTEALPGREFAGRVLRVSPTVDPATGNFRLTAEIDAGDGGLRPGMLVRVKITTDRRADAVLVPKKAVLYEGAQPVVFAVREGKAVRIPVEEGYSDLERMEVRNVGEDGVRPDDRVVVAGGADLRDGASVLVVEG